MSSGGVIIEQKGPNGWTIIGAGGLIGVALVIIALAVMQLATWAGIALIILASGQTIFNTCRGVALLIEAKGKRDDAIRMYERLIALNPDDRAFTSTDPEKMGHKLVDIASDNLKRLQE